MKKKLLCTKTTLAEQCDIYILYTADPAYIDELVSRQSADTVYKDNIIAGALADPAYNVIIVPGLSVYLANIDIVRQLSANPI